MKTRTDEQEIIFQEVKNMFTSNFTSTVGEVYVDAKAGCGKTTLAENIVESLKVENYIYTAFNKKIVLEGKERFGNEHSKTFHAFARGYLDAVGRVGNFYPALIKKRLSYPAKKLVVDTLKDFCLSSYVCPYTYFSDEGIPTDIGDLVVKYLGAMADRSMAMSWDYMLKELHLLLASGEVKISLDMLIVDEAQDLTPVVLATFDLVPATVKIYLGDTSQDIYTFLNLVSAFEYTSKVFPLTKSFRLSKDIAKRIEPFCKQHIDPKFVITGVNMSNDKTSAYITHSNSEIVLEIYSRHKSGDTYSLTKDVDEVFEVAVGVSNVLRGIKSKKPKYWELEKMLKTHSVKTIINSEEVELEDDIIASLKILQVLDKHGIDVDDLLAEAKSRTPDLSKLVSTAHSIKGMEYGTVTLSDNLNRYVRNAIENEDEEAKVAACKLYYVACSRAKHSLLNAQLL